MDKLIIEMLSNRTPLIFVHTNIFVIAKTLFPCVNIVKELPGLKHLGLAHNTLAGDKTLTAYQLGNSKALKQLHADATNCCQTSLVGVSQAFCPRMMSSRQSDSMEQILKRLFNWSDGIQKRHGEVS